MLLGNIVLIVYWAMRGGGAGSWGVIVSATFQTFTNFDVAVSHIIISTNTTDQMAEVAKVHAQHIFDWDALRAGQYFYLTVQGNIQASIISPAISSGVPTIAISTYFPSASLDQAAAALKPFIDDVQAVDGVNFTQSNILQNVNDAFTASSDDVGSNSVIGSRLVSAAAYKNPTLVGQIYSQLMNEGSQ